MRSDEQLVTSLDSLDGFLIPRTGVRSVPPRLFGLEEVLAAPSIRDAPWLAVNVSDDPSSGPQGDIEGRDVVAAEVAALAVASSRALVAPSDALVEPASRVRVAVGREIGPEFAYLGALIEDGGLVDPFGGLVAAPTSGPPRDLDEEASIAGRRRSALSSEPFPSAFDLGRSSMSSEHDPASIPHDARLDDLPSPALEDAEARLSRIAARLEDAVDRIESTVPSSLGSRRGGFRGRIDD